MPIERTPAQSRCRGLFSGLLKESVLQQPKAGLHSAQLAQSTLGRLTIGFFLPCTNSRSLITLRQFSSTQYKISLLFIFQNFTHSQVLPVKGNRAPAALPLENSLNNCTPSKIALQVWLVPTDLQIISLEGKPSNDWLCPAKKYKS